MVRCTPPLRLQDEPFVRGRAFDFAQLAKLVSELFHAGVRRLRVVMHGPDGLGQRECGHRGQVLRVGVTPARLLDPVGRVASVLGERVLALGDPDVGTLRDLHQVAVRRGVGLVVGRERNHVVAVLDAVAVRFLRVVEFATHDLHGPAHVRNLEGQTVVDGVELHFRARVHELTEIHRENRRFHLPVQNLVQVLVPVPTTVERQLVVEHALRHEDGAEEWKALDVVPVHVALENHGLHPLVLEDFGLQGVAEFAQSRTHVQDQQNVVEPNFDACGVAAVSAAHLERQVALHPGVKLVRIRGAGAHE